LFGFKEEGGGEVDRLLDALQAELDGDYVLVLEGLGQEGRREGREGKGRIGQEGGRGKERGRKNEER
jgi:hypothetical protein